jgi:hydroxypyruvate reductase
VVRAALGAVDAGRLVRRAIGAADVDAALHAAAAVDVVAAGKAARSMLDAFVAAAPVPPRRVLGIGPAGDAPASRGVRWLLAAHPVPDAASVAAARAALAAAQATGPRDVLLVLLSGGASAMMALPAEGLTLADKQRTSATLLSLGAEIHDLNTVRKHLSAVKGGQLAAACQGATLTLALSDVVGDDLSAIGSGPTVPDATTFRDARAALERYGGATQYPAAVVARLTRGEAGVLAETPKPGDSRLARSTAVVIGGYRTALDGARAAAERLGYVVHVVDRPVVGEARHAAHDLIGLARAYGGRIAPRAASDRRGGAAGGICIVAGGETTVRIAGSGKGGRNQELALAMARELDVLGARVVAASVGTDGVDGPTDAAGAIVDSTTLARAEAADIGPPERFLEEHNSYVCFDELHDLIRTGPTGTNVGDIQVILVGG